MNNLLSSLMQQAAKSVILHDCRDKVNANEDEHKEDDKMMGGGQRQKATAIVATAALAPGLTRSGGAT
jgi:hypothetical protein